MERFDQVLEQIAAEQAERMRFKYTGPLPPHSFVELSGGALTMGFFTGLLTLPLAPVRGVTWVVDQVADEVDRQLYDEGSIRRELLQLELELRRRQRSTKTERLVREEELFERLAIAHERRAATGEVRRDG